MTSHSLVICLSSVSLAERGEVDLAEPGVLSALALPFPAFPDAAFSGILELVHQGPVVQSVVSLTRLLRVISLTVLVDSIYNILIFFAEKM